MSTTATHQHHARPLLGEISRTPKAVAGHCTNPDKRGRGLEFTDRIW
jgi:hypothetical protein